MKLTQRWSLSDVLSEYFKDLNSMKNPGCQSNIKKNFKNLLGPGVEISPMLWDLGFNVEIKKEIFKNLVVQSLKG